MLDYDTTFKPAAQEALYEPNQYRTSDHDPVVVGLNPNAAPTVDAGGPYTAVAGFTVASARPAATRTATRSPTHGISTTTARSRHPARLRRSPPPPATAPGTHTIQVRATDPGGLAAVDTATVTSPSPTRASAPLMRKP